MLTGTEHFSLGEVQANTEWPIPPEYQDEAQATLETLEQVRRVLGVPLRLTSLWRSPETNAALPGHAAHSQHMLGQAADFVPLGISLQTAAQRWAQAVDAGTAPELHQFLAEETGEDGLGAHIHIGRGTGQQTLARTPSGAYLELRDWLRREGLSASAAVSSAATSAASTAAAHPGISLGLVAALLGGGFLAWRVLSPARA